MGERREVKAWRCRGGHVMGMVVRTDGVGKDGAQTVGVRQLILYRQAISFGGDEEVEVIAIVEGYVIDVRCSLCGRVKTWMPDEEALKRLIEQMREREVE